MPTIQYNFVLNALLGEFTSVDSIYQSYEPTIWMAVQLSRAEWALNRLTTADNPQCKRSLLPFLGDTLQWLMGTATMNDTREIRWQVHLLIQEQTQQQETLIHVISILNITRCTTQVNGQKLNEVMDALQKANKDMNILFNITDILLQHLKYHQIYTYAHTILTHLRDCLKYMRQVATDTMDYVDAATTNVLSPDILPVEEHGNMSRHIKAQLLSIIYLPISSDNTLHFYWYIKTHTYW